MMQMLNVFKQLALNAVEETSPTDVCFGNVVSVNPLKINVDYRFTLDEKFLVSSSLVADFDVDVKSEQFQRTYTVKLGLKVGEKVVLLRKKGGQQYLVLDRVR